jgi:8-oxo-dGTP pyrophosphatase MutT (NUDIX family)
MTSDASPFPGNSRKTAAPDWEPPSFERLAERLGQRLQGALPGRAAHRDFPHELAYGRHSGPPPVNARPAAVLILLYPLQQQWHLPMLLRPGHMAAHAGQVAFPGGMTEPGESPEQCAAREAFEELGIEPEGLLFLGRLSPIFVFASNFRVTPCVAVGAARPKFQIQPEEVDEVIELPLAELWNPTRQGRHVVRRQGIEFEVPHVEFSDRRIWGATRMLLGELQHLIETLSGRTTDF